MPASIGMHAHVGDVALSVRRVIKRLLWPIIVGCAVITFYLALSGKPGATAFAMIASSTILGLAAWEAKGEGLPLLPMFLVQNLVIYGLPIAIGDESVLHYPEGFLSEAAWEVLAFNVTLIIGWKIAMQIMPTYPSLCFALQGFDGATPRLARLGMGLLIVGTGYDMLQSSGLIDSFLSLLPPGSASITHVLAAAASACGFFLTGLMLSKGELGNQSRIIFWSLLLLECFISAGNFLLSAAITVVFSATIGLFWGGGKLPLKFLVGALTIFGFLNLGKFTMRDRYWHTDDGESQIEITLVDMPRTYSEWFGASVDVLTGKPMEAKNQNAFLAVGQSDEDKMRSGQNLLARINNLQNLLFVIDAMNSKHIPPLGGATYSLIPPLLIPRILWPQKPRSHEGQILLNVYFGRQDLDSTFQTYIAWGLLPEAYGNFGPITGAVVLGTFLAAIFAWIEKYVARKLLLSMEGFLSFTLFLGMANSYEMVASVLVTSLFQAFAPIIVACAPFVDRVLPKSKQNVDSQLTDPS